MAAVDGKQEFAFHTQLRDGEDERRITYGDALAMFRAAVGADIDAAILSRASWTAGHALVAERFRRGRVFLGGDAAHLFTPAGGLGYNTAVEDAVNLGWKLAADVRGHGGPVLLESYEFERRPAAIRNTGYARGFADSLGHFVPKDRIEEDSPVGEELRREAGAYLEKHGRAEFDIPGITFGTRYDGSPILWTDASSPPDDAANTYSPSASPGGRAPHLWLTEDQSLFDVFGSEWTLLRLGRASPAERFVGVAQRRGLDLEVVDVPTPEARELYQAPLVLIRPDQVVAWRGLSDRDADVVLALATGRSVRPVSSSCAWRRPPG
jgi:hypothetical protein